MAIYHGGGWEGGYGPRPRIDLNEAAKQLTINAYRTAGAQEEFLEQIEHDLKAIKDGTYTLSPLQQKFFDMMKEIYDGGNDHGVQTV